MKKGNFVVSILIFFILIEMISVIFSKKVIAEEKSKYINQETNSEVNIPTIQQILADFKNKNQSHMRILATENQIDNTYKFIVEENIEEKQEEKYEEISKNANEILNEDVSKFQEGSILSISRQVKTRIENLGFMYKILSIKKDDARLSEEERESAKEEADLYAERAWKELEAICNFESWNPSNFLDTAEMAYAVSLGYDWFYDTLNEEDRTLIEKALIEKALLPSTDNNYAKSFNSIKSNWNQVCNGGLGVAALSLLERNEVIDGKNITDSKILDKLGEQSTIHVNELAAAIIARTIENYFFQLEGMGPDGGYPEGIGYWEYGSTYMVYFLSTIQNTLGTNYDITQLDYLKKTILLPIYLTGKSNSDEMVYNYSDSTKKIVNTTASVWLSKYYADKNKEDINLAYLTSWYQQTYVTKITVTDILWYDPQYNIKNAYPKGVTEEELEELGLEKDKLIRGEDVAILKQSYLDNTGISIEMKAGHNQVRHGDLDIGSFVLDALGTRWISDYGSENYNVYGYWDMSSFRWNYYKKRAESHSTLVINPSNEIKTKNGKEYATADQYIYGQCNIDTIESSDDMAFAIMDISNAYNANDNNIDYTEFESNKNSNQVKRGIKLFDNRKRVMLQDELNLEKNQRFIRI